jgi:RNA polymerase sigma-70 factor, ECF subfamily
MQVININSLSRSNNNIVTESMHNYEKIEDTCTLVKLIQSKSEKGFHILYDKYSVALYGVIMKLVQQSDIADDLLQDTFVKIWKYIDRFDSEKGTLFTWMLNIARNQSIDYLRSSSHKTQSLRANVDMLLLDMDYIGKSATTINEIEFNYFKTIALSALDSKYAIVINLILFYGCTHEQAANLLNLPLGTIKTRVRKGMDTLKILYQS